MYDKYRISLNPKKNIFAVTEGKLLGYLISKEGIIIDHERIESITTNAFLKNKKAMQSFLGKINFVFRFISRFVEIIKHFQALIKEDEVCKWNREGKEAFKRIKQAIVEAPTLISHDFDKEFILYTFFLLKLHMQLSSHKRMMNGMMFPSPLSVQIFKGLNSSIWKLRSRDL